MCGVVGRDELNREGFIKIGLFFFLFFFSFLLFLFSLLDLFCFCFCFCFVLFVCLPSAGSARSLAVVEGGQTWTFRDSFRFVSKNPGTNESDYFLRPCSFGYDIPFRYSHHTLPYRIIWQKSDWS